jgi:hypothetical protein
MEVGRLNVLRSVSWLLAVAVVGLAVPACGGSNESAETTKPTPIVRNEPAPGLPYLLYTSDRDGDAELYGVRADGRRTVQISRDELDSYGWDLLIAPNWRWVHLDRKDGSSVLVSSDGRHVARVPGGCAMYPVFSADGTLFASGQDTDCLVTGRIRQPQVRLFDTIERRFRTLVQGEPVSFSPGRRLLAVLDLRVTAYEDKYGGLNFVDTDSGDVVGAIDRRDAADFTEIGWSPSGTWFAYLAGRRLFVVDVTTATPEPRLVLRDPRLDSESWYELPARWLDDQTLGVLLTTSEEEHELSVVARDGEKTTLAVLASSYQYKWSPDGSHVAYVEPVGEAERIVVDTAAGSNERVVFEASYPSFDWTPGGQLIVNHEENRRQIVELVDLDGRSEEILRTRRSVSLGPWSPDGRFLSLGTDVGERGATTLGILALADRSVTSVPVTGNVKVIGWADSSVREAGAPSEVPSPELASTDHLRSYGELAEISASGRRVAAIVESSKLDCRHVVAWTVGSSRVVRFSEPRPCGGDEEDLLGIALEGTRLTWTGESWGNYAYLTDNSADMRRPEAGVRSSGGDEGYETGMDRPKPERATRRGVSVRVEDGAVVLTRASDGRAVRLLAPGPVVDAELENEGLFYAYNTGGTMKGRIVFVPFAKLLG